MAYVTQSRSFQIKGMTYRNSYSGVGDPMNCAGIFPAELVPLPTQTTTGFRSGKSAAGLEDEDDLTSTGSTNAGTYSRLKRESDHGSESTSFDNGHTFDSRKEEVVGFTTLTTKGRAGEQYEGYTFSGPCIPDPFISPWSPVGYPQGSPKVVNTTWWEKRAIERTIPTSPVANLSQGVAEIIREGIPKMVGHTLTHGKDNLRKAIGGEFLNWEFGWKPIIGDLKAIARVVIEHDELLNQLERNSGRNVRRRHKFEPLIDVTSNQQTVSALLYAQGLGPVMANAVSHGGTKLTQVDRRETNIWYSGAYTYYLQPRSKEKKAQADRIAAQAQYLLGLDLTAEVVWELAPWSWLSDWYANIGTNLTNASRFQEDSLVQRYGYLMVKTITESTRVVTGAATWATPIPSASLTTRTTVMSRKKATPYGFALNPTSFTGRQWAILGALGLTKSPTSLRGE